MAVAQGSDVRQEIVATALDCYEGCKIVNILWERVARPPGAWFPRSPGS